MQQNELKKTIKNILNLLIIQFLFKLDLFFQYINIYYII